MGPVVNVRERSWNSVHIDYRHNNARVNDCKWERMIVELHTLMIHTNLCLSKIVAVTIFLCLYSNSACLYRDRQRWNEDYSHKLVTAWIRIPLQFWITYASWEVALHNEGCCLMFCNTFMFYNHSLLSCLFQFMQNCHNGYLQSGLWRFLCNLIDRYLVLTLLIFLPSVHYRTLLWTEIFWAFSQGRVALEHEESIMFSPLCTLAVSSLLQDSSSLSWAWLHRSEGFRLIHTWRRIPLVSIEP